MAYNLAGKNLKNWNGVTCGDFLYELEENIKISRKLLKIKLIKYKY